MYRLCKFYVSDIIAGGNIFRNAHFPVYSGNRRADHGMIYAENGTCKTTLLSFFFSVFCPEQRRFVQHLQSGGDKTMQQYLIPERPAIIILDLVTVFNSPFFGQEPGEHLLIGQLLYQNRDMSHRPDRIFFIARSSDLIEDISHRWDGLLRQERPYNAVRDYLESRVDKCSSQKEWEEKLEEIGLDPWLVNRQVDFARSEGGIKDSFRFRSESEFLEFFLGCVSNMESAKQLREENLTILQKMKDRPEKKARLKAVLSLKERMEGFGQAAQKWRNARESLDFCKKQMGEAAHLLKYARTNAEQLLQNGNSAYQNALESKGQTERELSVIKAGIIKTEEFECSQNCEKNADHIRVLDEKIQNTEAELHAIDAANIIEKIRKKESELQINNNALNLKHSEIDPCRDEVHRRAAQYHARLSHEMGQIRLKIQSIELKQAETGMELAVCRQERKNLEEESDSITVKIVQLDTKLISAEDSWQNFPAELKKETPQETHESLQQKMVMIEKDISDIRNQITKTEEELKTGKSRWTKLQSDRADAERHSYECRQKRDQEKREREILLKDAFLQTISGTAGFEPTGAELPSHLNEAITRYQNQLEQRESDHRGLKEEIRWLKEIHTLTSDRQTASLITHYYKNGLSPAEIRAFPDYLASLKDNPEEVAEYLKRDPGRFTGIMAASESVIEKIKDLSVPKWLKKPVVISMPCLLDEISENPQYVIVPEDSRIYSREGAKQLEAEFLEKADHLEKEIGGFRCKIESANTSARCLREYREKYPDQVTVEMLSLQLQEAEKKLASILSDIEESLNLSEEKSEYKKHLEERNSELSKRQSQYEGHVQNIDNWLKQYGQTDAWRKELGEKKQRKSELEIYIGNFKEKEDRLKKTEQELKEDLFGKQARLRELDSRGEDISSPGEAYNLSSEERTHALGLNLSDLKKLYDTAKETERQKSSELGIAALIKETDQLQESLQVCKSDLEYFKQKHRYDSQLADRWVSRDRNERRERKDILKDEQNSNREEKGRCEAKLESLKRDLGNCKKKLKEMEKQGILPNVSAEEIVSKTPEMLLIHLESEENRLQEKFEILKKRIPMLRKNLKSAEEYLHAIEKIQVATEKYDPCWDTHSPRLNWPDLLHPDEPERMAHTVSLRRILKEIVENEADFFSKLELSRKERDRFFDRLRNYIHDDLLQKHIPAITDQLRSYDADSLSDQIPELTENCGYVARNIEADLANSQQTLYDHIARLLGHAGDCCGKIKAAAQVRIPENVFLYGGRAILRAGSTPDLNKSRDIFLKSIENWIDELIQQNRCPQVNDRVGNCLGAELLYRLLQADSGGLRQEFGIRLLKCDDTGKKYEPVGKDLGSGGEALTTAVLLYTLLVSMRQNRYGRKSEKIPAFLLLDNPIGVCNRPDFLDAQLKVAKALGIQCVYLTGIHDTGSVELFEHRLVIRKTGKQLNIESIPYHILEVVDMNVEK